uniref:Uncharacterized protein n=1 Tax=Knipowitschia caucasica TaxID=637954 RepID=A0AAV2MTI9_KNICA
MVSARLSYAPAEGGAHITSVDFHTSLSTINTPGLLHIQCFAHFQHGFLNGLFKREVTSHFTSCSTLRRCHKCNASNGNRASDD